LVREAALTIPFKFHCTECGVRVESLLPPLSPLQAPTRCFVCKWLADIPDGGERTALRTEFLELLGDRPGAGWGERG
jgi:hypothetical protein